MAGCGKVAINDGGSGGQYGDRGSATQGRAPTETTAPATAQQKDEDDVAHFDEIMNFIAGFRDLNRIKDRRHFDDVRAVIEQKAQTHSGEYGQFEAQEARIERIGRLQNWLEKNKVMDAGPSTQAFQQLDEADMATLLQDVAATYASIASNEELSKEAKRAEKTRAFLVLARI